MPDANSAMLVLKYMLSNRMLFIKAYHNRVYSYSSGTKFTEVATRLKTWLTQLKGLRQKDPSLPNPKRALKTLTDVLNLHAIVGDIIIMFMEQKPQPFLTGALAVCLILTHTHTHTPPHYTVTLTTQFSSPKRISGLSSSRSKGR